MKIKWEGKGWYRKIKGDGGIVLKWSSRQDWFAGSEQGCIFVSKKDKFVAIR